MKMEKRNTTETLHVEKSGSQNLVFKISAWVNVEADWKLDKWKTVLVHETNLLIFYFNPLGDIIFFLDFCSENMFMKRKFSLFFLFQAF